MVCIEPVRIVASVESGSKTYFNERSYQTEAVSDIIFEQQVINSPRRMHLPERCKRKPSSPPSPQSLGQESRFRTQPG